VELLEAQDFRNVILVGHSYGGFVVAGAASRAAGRLAHLILIDSPVPRHGDTVFDHLPDEIAGYYRHQASTVGGGWKVPPPSLEYHHLSEADLAWLMPMVGAIPLKTCQEALHAPGDKLWDIPRTYVWCREYPVFAETAAKIRGEPGWLYRELTSGHLPMVTRPNQTAALLASVATSIDAL
jgi:pimeloyl-ACP methyl ester carboxylesterase